MTALALPIKLNKEPLVDAVFEIRFSSPVAASNILPGFFFAKLEPVQWEVEALPISQVPTPLRTSDPSLRYQPLMKIHWDDYLILIGDTMLGVACKMPYPRWENFKKRIIRAVDILMETKIVQNIERYSLKYDDIIEGENLAERLQRINMDIRIGHHIVKEEQFTIRVEVHREEFINIIQIVSSAQATITGGHVRDGTLIDTDTIRIYETSDFRKFIDDLPTLLEKIHTENKKTFFECLKPETVVYLEPIYE